MSVKKPTQKMFFDGEVEPDQNPESQPETKKVDTPTESPLGSSKHNILELPSMGLLGYPSEVEYRDILVGDEETLASASIETYSKTLNSVLKDILNDCPFYEQLATFDRDFILIWLWANNYGIVKDIEVTCQHCKHEATQTVDLTEFPVTDLKEDIPVPFTIPLKNSTMESVDVHLMTVADEIEVEAYVNKHKKADLETISLIASIDTGFKTTLEKKVTWARTNISAREMAIVRDFHRYFKFGADATIEHVCPECEGVTRGPLPFQTEDILRPQARSSFDDLLQAAKGSKATSK